MTKVLMSVFAGRKRNLEILLQYTDILYSRGLLHELQLWDFTVDPADAAWIRSLKNPYVVVKAVPRNRRMARNNFGALIMPGQAKGNWLVYYRHFNKLEYPDHVIIKCDDDIVFIDVDEFSGFVQRRLEDQDHLIAFPSIVNNGVCAYHQQQLGLVPQTVGEFPYDTAYGKLWGDGQMCQRLHEYFIDNYDEWLNKTKQLPEKLIHPVGDRFSINFFAITSALIEPVYHRIGMDDEKCLSQDMSVLYQKSHYIDMHMTVAHCAFHAQRDNGRGDGKNMDEGLVLQKYKQLATKIGAK